MRNISVAYDKISVLYYSILQDIFLGRSEAALYVTIRLERFNPWQFLRCFVVTYIACSAGVFWARECTFSY